MKLTDWYDGGQKPARVGVYQRNYSPINGEFIVYCRWDGVNWFTYGQTIEEAASRKCVTYWKSLPWRGIAK